MQELYSPDEAWLAAKCNISIESVVKQGLLAQFLVLLQGQEVDQQEGLFQTGGSWNGDKNNKEVQGGGTLGSSFKHLTEIYFKCVDALKFP